MMMGLPLPKVVADVGPGGPLVTAMGGINALAHNMLKRKYYAPDMESQINNRNALTEGQKIENQYMPDKLRMANAFSQLRNQYYGPNMESEINNRNALTNKNTTMTPLEAKELELKNEWYPKTEQANINWKNSGGSAGGVDMKLMSGFQQQLSTDHPEWNPEQLNEAANAYLSGEQQLLDGSPLPQIGGKAKQYLDRMALKATTAPLITSGVKANQAEAELQVLNKYANAGLKPYGTTYFNKSPQQVLDSFKSDKASQTRLGQFIASQALQFEIAQNRIKLANGQPGVTSTQELMDLSKQTLKAKYPRLSQQAREEATRYMDEALREGLKARQSVDIGASGLRKNNNNNNNNNTSLANAEEKYEVDYNKPSGSVGMRNEKGELFFIPSNEVKKYRSKGYTYDD